MSQITWTAKQNRPPLEELRVYNQDFTTYCNQLVVQGPTEANSTYLISVLRDSGTGSFPPTNTSSRHNGTAYLLDNFCVITANADTVADSVNIALFEGNTTELTRYTLFDIDVYLNPGQSITIPIPDIQNTELRSTENIYFKLTTKLATCTINFRTCAIAKFTD